MGRTIDTKIDDGILTFTFTNSQGEIFSMFKMNPSDIKLAARCEEALAWFEEIEKTPAVFETAKEAADFNNKIEEKINYVLGYEASKDLFKEMTATSVLPNGLFFAYIVLEKIASTVEPEAEKRRIKMEKMLSKYTEKYNK